MANPATSQSIANQAITIVGNNQPLVTAGAPNFDSSTTGKILAQIYAPAVATVARQWGWDQARNQFTLVLTGNPPPLGWAYEYAYPPNGIQVWQITPPFPLTDPNNPLPVNWNTGNNIVAATQTKVIWTNQAGALCVYNNNPNESTWDPLFQEAVVRLLASEIAMAAAGRPDTSQAMLESGGAFETIGESRSD